MKVENTKVENKSKCENFTSVVETTKVEIKDVSPHLTQSHARRLLKFAGKLALASRLVTTANARNLSQRIEQMEHALDEYDNEIIAVSGTNGLGLDAGR